MNTNIRNLIIAVVVLAVAPYLLYPVFLAKLLCFALFAAAFNLLLGYAGILSFGHAAFLSTGGYITGWAMMNLGVSTEIGILMGTVAGALLGAIYGKLAIKREGIYFAMVTLALAQLTFFVYLQSDFTGGENGMQGIPRGNLFGLIDLTDNVAMYYTVAVIFLIGFAIIQRTVHSPFGQVLKAIRENEPRAISLGYNVNNYKWLAFIISSALAALAGSTKTIVFNLASLTDAHWHMSGEVILMTLVGGVGTLMGPVVGAGVIVTMQNYLSTGDLGNYIHIIMGAVFVICVLAFRAGIVGQFKKFKERNF
ncbi:MULTISPECIES: branched-chain amino acid ABC transporter permease [unclassified Marinobacterium]|jgi:branched-chain amino acid transport system permease protein|uniref:branched-chain amino acid ABC transporter permease n=1 Tax=unclassified Marinobacterium TaxID=2644139 RepID=UPI00156A431B|nr:MULTISPECIES: branched-chain amino acid ABC transporter permease [unclassified Marinobacterium]NRP14793.1 leucine/isoleucine/valine transporter permease subunit [Marinobacterium sp. xm-a-152]NRP27289.1 leucine/isoleucine/valine transporter permease subunit [Marinobacterium sp. xm-d-420]NRP38538.1 leucine/isoleucine/valine transporter permease subunit [Marinobacterium sp. xm-a-121]NRP52525.1 leucine/isoleucine/valine transporter permease subunit [Marinobacterium sp. xm-v-242]NRP58048.1 leuci